MPRFKTEMYSLMNVTSKAFYKTQLCFIEHCEMTLKWIKDNNSLILDFPKEFNAELTTNTFSIKHKF